MFGTSSGDGFDVLIFVLFKELHADKRNRQPGEAVNSTIKEEPNG
jgi:hypothetical protein